MSTEQKVDGLTPADKGTPRPWKVGEVVKGHYGLRSLPIEGPEGEVVAECEYLSDVPVAKDCAEANAALIVRAVNCHDELVAALQEFVNSVECFCADNVAAGNGACPVHIAEAALARARSEVPHE